MTLTSYTHTTMIAGVPHTLTHIPHTLTNPPLPSSHVCSVNKLYRLLGEKGMLNSTRDDVCGALRTVESQFSCSRSTLQQLSTKGEAIGVHLLPRIVQLSCFLSCGLTY